VLSSLIAWCRLRAGASAPGVTVDRRVALWLWLVLLPELALAQATPGPQQWLPVFIAPLMGPSSFDPSAGDEALRISGVSLRQFVPLSWPAVPRPRRKQLRVRLSNEFGDGPLVIDQLQVAWRAAHGGAQLEPRSQQALRFGGRTGVRIEAGQSALSDPFDMTSALGGGDMQSRDLAISFYLAQRSPRVSWHPVASRRSYRSAAGRHLAARGFPVARVERSLYFITAVEAAWTPPLPPVWVAFGDSITDGAWHRVDADTSWPLRWRQAWSERLGRPAVVLNAGLSGNRLLTALDGPSGRARFERDVLALAGVRGVVLHIGINDLGSAVAGTEAAAVAATVIAGQAELLRRARAQGIKVVGATLTPIHGSMHDHPGTEAARQAVNAWIRQGAGFDAVVDFDAAVRDPARPERFRPGWTIDFLHPTDAAYGVMASTLLHALDQSGLSPHSAKRR
jgi:lysophospholipase L1-like esterase